MKRLGEAATAAILCLVLSGFESARGQDTLIVHAENRPVWGAELHLVEELRIGVLEGSEDFVFGNIVSLTVAEDGVITIAEFRPPFLRQYGPDGTFLRRIGGEGEGPGEFREILSTQVLSSGDIAAWDSRLRRISVFSSRGDFIRSHRVSVPTSYTADPFRVDTTGNFYVKVGRPDGRARVEGGISAKMWVELSPSGEILDSIPLPRLFEGPGYTVSTSSGERYPFLDLALSCLGSQGQKVNAKTSAYSIDVSARGRPVVRIVRDLQPVAVTREERSQWERWNEHEAADLGISPTAYPRIPRTKPPLADLQLDSEGRIWVLRSVSAVHRPHTREELEQRGDRPPFEWVEPPVWDVLSPEGVLLGTVSMPENGRLGFAKGKQVWVVERDELDVDYVVRYRIEGL